MRFSVYVLTTARGGNMQLSVREVGETMRSLYNREHELNCDTSWTVRRISLDAFECECVSVCLGGGRFHVARCSLRTSVLRLPPSLNALVSALKVSCEFHWTMKTICIVPLPLPSSFPCYPLPKKQDVMDPTSEMSKRDTKASLAGHKKNILACTQTIRTYITKPPWLWASSVREDTSPWSIPWSYDFPSLPVFLIVFSKQRLPVLLS